MATILEKTDDSTSSQSEPLKVADAIWIATATLHQQSPNQEGFERRDIVEQVEKMNLLTPFVFRTVWQHVDRHCVANREPKPNRTRMLFDKGHGIRSLYKDSDYSVPLRKGAPTHPEWSSLPMEFKDLQRWYEEEWNASSVDPLLALEGTWTFGHAEEYLRNLRQGWD